MLFDEQLIAIDQIDNDRSKDVRPQKFPWG